MISSHWVVVFMQLTNNCSSPQLQQQAGQTANKLGAGGIDTKMAVKELSMFVRLADVS